MYKTNIKFVVNYTIFLFILGISICRLEIAKAGGKINTFILT